MYNKVKWVNYMAELLKKNLRDWLHTAHTMEVQAEQLFESQAKRLVDHPATRNKLEDEAKHSRTHQELLSIRITQLGDTLSLNDDDMPDTSVADIPNMMEMTMSEAPVKIILALYTFSQMEVSSLKVISKAAEVLNDYETMKISETILKRINARTQWMSIELNKSISEFFGGASFIDAETT